MYDKGLGVPHDQAEAAKWHRKAAENGMGHAQYTLGFAHVFGKGVPQDLVSAYMRIASVRNYFNSVKASCTRLMKTAII